MDSSAQGHLDEEIRKLEQQREGLVAGTVDAGPDDSLVRGPLRRTTRRINGHAARRTACCRPRSCQPCETETGGRV